jgi:putative copper export protein
VNGEPLIAWPQPIFEYGGFLASFFTAGAAGFRWAVIARSRAGGGVPGDGEAAVERVATLRAAGIGLIGALLGAALFARSLPATAARHHQSVAQLVSGNAMTATQLAMVAITLIGFALALAGGRTGWVLAALGVLGGALRAAFFGQWERLVNPLHVLAGGMWIGTLFVLVFAGLATALTSALPPERRGALVARWVNAFSPLALVSAAMLATFGVITAWRHLKRLDALWTTPYGYALIVKLCVVAVVVAIGAWNWRRVKPRLGGEDGARVLERSARVELAIAALVLAVTAILVSLPSPD